ncbi:MAG: hypothetical protein HZB56_22745 [Deltaproteobacteria bacterium]|nr:hypothetical protein [Deltaproteobacteria bacterium]
MRRRRSPAYVAAIAKLDAGTMETSRGAIDALVEAVAAEFPELGTPDYPLGFLARCYLGAPYEVHTLDFAGGIICHYRRGEPLPPEFEKARGLAQHQAYAFIEVYRDSIHCVAADGATTRVEPTPT